MSNSKENPTGKIKTLDSSLDIEEIQPADNANISIPQNSQSSPENPVFINNGFNTERSNRISNQKNFYDSQDYSTITLKNQINQLKQLLDNKNTELEKITSENSNLKSQLLKKEKDLLEKENNLNTLNTNFKNLETKNKDLNKNYSLLQDTNKNLNTQIIELTQKLTSNQKLLEDLKSVNNQNDPQSKYESTFKKLYNLTDELEIKNNKLIFDNKALSSKLEDFKKDMLNEKKILKNIYTFQIDNLNKSINSLNIKISELLAEKNKLISEQNLKFKKNSEIFPKNEILRNFDELVKKIRKYDEENFMLKKLNQKYQNDLEEIKLISEGKDQIIEKLRNEYCSMSSNINNEGYINNLLQEKTKMQDEISRLKQGLKTMNYNVNQANLLFLERKKNYEDALILKENKINEYKQKIATLKIKINELYNEINVYKEYKEIYENNRIPFLSGKGNNIFLNNKDIPNNIKVFEEDKDNNAQKKENRENKERIENKENRVNTESNENNYNNDYNDNYEI